MIYVYIQAQEASLGMDVGVKVPASGATGGGPAKAAMLLPVCLVCIHCPTPR